MQARPFDYAILALGVAAVTTAALFIREAAAPALVIGAWRLGLASLVLTGGSLALRRPLLISTARRSLLAALAGLFLALHFAFWIASVQQTSIVTSVALVTSQPLFVALASIPLLRERPTGATWIGVAVAAAGAAVMIADDLGAGRDTLLGDLYALIGAACAAAYFLIGRALRAGGETWLSYVAVAYSTAAVVLILLAAAGGESFVDYPARTFAFFVLLALVPQLIGHTALNRTLGYLPAVSVTIAVLGEPLGATLLAAIFLSEAPTALELVGGLLVLAGVYTGLRGGVISAARGANGLKGA